MGGCGHSMGGGGGGEIGVKVWPCWVGVGATIRQRPCWVGVGGGTKIGVKVWPCWVGVGATIRQRPCWVSVAPLCWGGGGAPRLG